MKITLKGNPKSTQTIYRAVCRGKFAGVYMSKVGKDLKKDYKKQIKEQYQGEPIEGELAINVLLYFKDKRKRDWDNFHKLTMDAMSGLVWVDDEQIVEAHVFKEFDKENPRVEIIILHD